VTISGVHVRSLFEGTYVEEVVDTSPLLEELDSTSDESTVCKPRDTGWLASEAFYPSTLPGALLLVDGILHLLEVRVDQLVVGVVCQASETSH